MLRSLILRRLGSGVLILWLISVLVFVAIHLLPGNAASSILGRDATPFTLQVLTKQLGLDQPLAVQYWHWVTGLLSGHWGESLVSSLSVSQVVTTHLAYTGVLTLFTMAVIAPLAIVIGTYSATRNGGPVDSAASAGTLVLSAIPSFAIGIVVIYLFATDVFHVLPAASLVDPEKSVWSQLRLAIAPTITVVLSTISYPIRMVRASMIDVMHSDYVQMARLKGVAERRVVMKHALRNGLAPMTQSLGLTLLYLSGGVVVVETIFSYPGIGYALIQAVEQRDVPVIQTVVVLLAAACVVINLVADVAVAFLTPRLRVTL
jgi:peptide/nickel transport system permease protein